MTQSVFIQVGQCGNQIGCRFWDLALREYGEITKKPVFDESLGSFFRNVDPKTGKEILIGDGTKPISSLKARAVLVDMEEGVINQLSKGPMQEVFDWKQFITSSSGSGNNWAVGNKFYGSMYREKLHELIRRAVEMCDCLQTFFIIHSMGGGTGSGVGTSILELLEDEFPNVYRFVVAVYPSGDDDVITSPYNSVLAMKELTKYADCVLPIDNESLSEICGQLNQAADIRMGRRCSTASLRNSVSSLGSDTIKENKSFDQMNNIVANLLLNLTSSSRFEGSMNVDLNEITTNLVPYPKLHYLTSSIAPLYSLSDVNIPPRRIDQMFSDAFSPDCQLVKCDPRKGTFLASAVLVRGNVEISDIRRNISRLQGKLKFVPWNVEGWKTGLCKVPPLGHQYSLLALSNNTCLHSKFEEVLNRFNLLYRRKAHLHHYLQVEGMEAQEFDIGIESLSNLIQEYKNLETEENFTSPKLEVVA